MLSTGDVQSCLRKLEVLLRSIKYPENVDYDGLSKGDPSAFLPIMSFTLTTFSPAFAEQLIKAGLELSGKTDLRFTDTLYKVLRDVFHYKPVLTKQQFLLTGFSQRKLSFLCDLINLVLHKHKQLNKPRVRCPMSNRNISVDVHPSQTDADNVPKKKNQPTFIANPILTEASSHHNVTCASDVKFHSYDSSGNETNQLQEGKELEEENVWSSEVEGRLSALEAQIQSHLSEFSRLSLLEKRIEELEKRRTTDENGGQNVVISRESWENLMSRVLLLETKLELGSTQFNASLPTQSSTFSSSSISDPSTEALTARLDKITNMLKTTSDLLKNSESADTSSK
ncbi:centrosomal protein of 44 kDa isoform X2 [Melanotaenia boesemani]|uniref:centrosomal protein of 44 kDa isoform X2 n=1 Tax=Melanotaenia boesemani TaxID=1250792 RepID=UPI001C03A619|nr:centrosomal protein of 44 kDa isoform X2 [Melanotaenia boesemani]